MGASTKQTQTLFRLPEFRAEDVADPELFARKMNEMRRQLEIASLTLNSINDVLTQDTSEHDQLAYDSESKRWVNRNEADFDQLETLSDSGFIRVIEQGSGGAFPALISAANLNGRGALVTRITSNISLPTATGVDISFNSEEYDTDGFHDLSTNPERLTIPSGISFVRVSAQAFLADGASTGTRQIEIRKNGNAVAGSGNERYEATALDTIFGTQTAVLAVEEADYFTVSVYQDSGATKAVRNSGLTWFCIEVLA